MTIPTRDELIERASAVRFMCEGHVADFALAEIRRAVAEELEALRLCAPAMSAPGLRKWIDARLAALRQTEQPPGAATVAEPRTDRAKPCDGAAGSTPAPGSSNGPDLSGHDDFGVRPAQATPGDPARLSDADVLERAAEIMRSRSASGAYAAIVNGHLCDEAAKLRAASVPAPAPKPVDVFEAFQSWKLTRSPGVQLDRAARDWFGPLLDLVNDSARHACQQPAAHVIGTPCGACAPCKARTVLSALRQRAQEASRG